MKERRHVKTCRYGILVGTLFMTLLLTQMPVEPAGTDPCAPYSQTKDSDGDGFSDYDECRGITFAGPGGQGLDTTFPGSMNIAKPRTDRLDPNSPDLFVILVPGTYFPLLTNPLEFVSNLGIAVHKIDQNQAGIDRTVCKTTKAYSCTIPTGQTILQKAVKVTEDPELGSGPNLLILGSSPSMHGTPNEKDLATVYTLRIKNHIQSVCGCADWASCIKCCDNSNVCGMDLFYKYIKHTIAHEIAHQLMLTSAYSQKWGWHYPENTGVELDYKVFYKGTIFNLGTTFTDADRSGFALR